MAVQVNPSLLRAAASRPRETHTMSKLNQLTRTSRSYALLGLLLAGAAGLPASILAQEAPAQLATDGAVVSVAAVTPESAVASTSSATAVAPLVMRVALPTFTTVAAANAFAVEPFQDRARMGPNVALMAVGGAALIIGLAIGGDSGMIIAAGGAVIGLVGLYRFLK